MSGRVFACYGMFRTRMLFPICLNSTHFLSFLIVWLQCLQHQVLIVWDRIFGSFLDETAVLKIGTHHTTDADLPDTSTLPPRRTLDAREEKCLFGQRRSMMSIASGLHQLDEPVAHFTRVFSLLRAGRVGKAFHTLYRGPGWYTAGRAQLAH